MKIRCHCNATLRDQTDGLRNKGHVLADEAWFPTLDALDTEVIDAVADGRLSRNDAYVACRRILLGATRTAWQCSACGRLYFIGADRQLHCFAPEGEDVDHDVLSAAPQRTSRA